MPTNYKQLKMIEAKNKIKWLEAFGKVPNTSGIYMLTREENGFKYAYIGQAKHILTRLAQHLSGYQHIDLSLKKHKLFSQSNPSGWKLLYKEFPESELDDREQHYIKTFATAGYQLRNKTAGGQGEGKFNINEAKQPKTYTEGKVQGYENARRDVAKLFDKNLTYAMTDKPNKLKQRAYDKFTAFLKGEENEQ